MRITYESLLDAMRKGLRNRNWKRLSIVERAFYMASLHYTKIRSIVSANITEKIFYIVEKLCEKPSIRIFRRGFEHALKLLSEGVANPLRKWLKDPDFIFWLGASQGR